MLRLAKFFPILLIIFFVWLYIHNLSPSVYGGDVGDFVTAASVGGVAHPPGYPIFIFLGFLLIHALPFFTPAFAMGLISAFAGALGVVVCYLLVKLLTKSKWSAGVTAVTLGVSYLYWFYAEIAEVFAFHTLFILLLFYFSFLFDITRKRKWLYLWALTVGCASVTHQTIIFFIPSSLLILLPGLWKMRKQISVFLGALGLILLPWLSYIYVFVASAHHPVINWDSVHDFQSLLRLILRKDYGTFSAGLFAQPVFAQRLVILKTYLFTILTQVTIPVISISIVGLIALWFYSKRYVVALLLAFIIAGPLFISYAGFPLAGSFYLGVYERFFTMSTIPILILFGYGMFSLAKVFASFFERPLYFILLHVLLLLIPLQLFVYNMPKTDLSHIWIGDQLGADFLNPLPRGSILLVGGDTMLFNTWYMHYARHIRPDIKLVNLSLTSTDTLFKNEEAIVKKNNPHIKDNELLSQTVKELAKTIPIYSFQEVQPPGQKTLTWVPTGMVYKLSLSSQPEDKSTFLKDVQTTLQQIHLPSSRAKNYRNLTIADIPQSYANAFWAVGNYLQVTYKDVDTALYYYKKAISVDPTYVNAYTTMGLIYLINKNECSLAEQNFQAAIEQQPYGEFPYFLLYTTYTECFHDKKKASIVVEEFNKEFHKDFFKELVITLKSLKK